MPEKKSSTKLITITQQERESTKAYLKRFNEKTLINGVHNYSF
jgi:hypothetical protein